MIEVEIRTRIKSLDEIKSRLKELGAQFLKKEKQVDRIFGHPMFLDSDSMIVEGGLVARIRSIDSSNTLDFKEISRHKGGIEVRSKLKSVDAGLKLLRKLKFNESFTVSKSRETYSYNDFEICLDDVEQLGLFMEIEKTVSSEEEKEPAKKECVELLGRISPSLKIEHRKYGDMMQEIINRQNT